MNNLESKFTIQMKKSILLLWNLNNDEQCNRVDISSPNFQKLIYENKMPKLIYTIHLSSGKVIHKNNVQKSFRDFTAHISKQTIKCLIKKEIS